jgi:hypothetical protein
VRSLEAEPVYNMRIEGYHTYFVGSEYWGFSVWSHNTNECEELAEATTNAMRSPIFGNYVRRVDDYKHALDPNHVKAAMLEKKGVVVARKADGTPFDHLTETRAAMRGARDRTILLRKYLSDPNLSAGMRAAVESELKELSKMLDYAEEILGELAR